MYLSKVFIFSLLAFFLHVSTGFMHGFLNLNAWPLPRCLPGLFKCINVACYDDDGQTTTKCSRRCNSCVGVGVDSRNHSAPAGLVAIPLADTYDDMIKEALVKINMKKLKQSDMIDLFEELL